MRAMELRPATIVKPLIVLALLVFLVGLQFKTFQSVQGMDFEHYYVGATMVAAGQGAQLHDLETQFQWQARILGQVSTPFNYPAPMALLYWPTTLFDLHHGYLLWTALSALMFAVSVLLLNKTFGFVEDSWFLLLLCAGYLPFHATLSTGQCDAFLFLAYAVSLVCLKEGKPGIGGVVLSLALLKFHLVLPFALVMLLRKQWRFMLGFSAGGAAILGIWLWISGPGLFTAYPRLMMGIKELPRGRFEPQLMANFRGMFYAFIGHEAPTWMVAAVALAGLILVARYWSGIERGFASAIAMTLLTSYHGYIYDLILLLIPLMVGIRLVKNANIYLFTLVGFLAVPVVPYLLARERAVWLLAIPIAVLCWILMFYRAPERLHEVGEAGQKHLAAV
jgi:hypothetical protein